MKKLFVIAIILGALCAALVGCATTHIVSVRSTNDVTGVVTVTTVTNTPSPQTIDGASNIVQGITRTLVASVIAADKKENIKPYFADAVPALDVLFSGGQFDMDSMIVVMKNTPSTAFKSDSTESVIVAIAAAYDMIFQQAVINGIDRNAYAVPVALAVRNGIASAIK